MEGFTSQRLPCISPRYRSPNASPTRHSESRVGTFLIDTPRDKGMRHRESLWTFQRENRGAIKSRIVQLPEIPFRLGPSTNLYSPTSDTESRFSWSDDTSSDVILPKINNTDAVKIKRSRQQSPRSETNATDVIMAERGSVIHSNTFLTESSTPSARHHASGGCKKTNKITPGSSTDRLPQMRKDMHIARSLRRSASFVNFREDGCLSVCDIADDSVSSTSLDILSDNVGPTTNSSVDTRRTLADLLNKGEQAKFTDLNSKRQKWSQIAFKRKNTRSEENLSTDEADREWVNKFTTALIDGDSYNNYARTKKPTEVGKLERKIHPKRTYIPRVGDFDISRTEEGKCYPVFLKDGSPVRKFGVVQGRTKSHAKLKIALSNGKS